MRFYDSNRLGDMLFVFHKNHKKYLNDMLAQYDLNLIQVLCMLMIYEEDNLNQKDLSDGLYLTKGAITKAINKLEANDLVKREQCPQDKRKNVLKLSKKGLDLIPKIESVNNDWETLMGLKELDPEFIELFNKLTLKSIDLNLKKEK